MNIYYVYAYIRSKDSETAKAGTPYYIGKAKGNRAYYQCKGRSRASTPKDKNYIVICANDLSEIGAYALERKLIRWWGRKGIDEKGILMNVTNGGEGGVGGHYGWTIESKEKFRARSKNNNPGSLRKGGKLSSEWKNNISIGLKKSEYSSTNDNFRNEKISKSLSGKPKSKEHRKKLSESIKGRIPWNKGTSGVCKGSPGKRPRCSCILCGEELGINNITRHYNRYHND
jgi:hypothetical protein